MKKYILAYCVLMFSFISLNALAQTISVKLKVSYGAENEEAVTPADLKAGGWIETVNADEEVVYTTTLNLKSSALPISKSLGPVSFSIDKKGLLKLGSSVGDMDAGAEASLQLPMLKTKLLPQSPLKLGLVGGDYAGGSWSVNSSLEVEVKP